MLDVNEFVEKLGDNEELAAALSKVASKEELIAKAKEFGFELKDEDLAGLKKLLNETELSEDELGAVAGGQYGSALNAKINSNLGAKINSNLGAKINSNLGSKINSNLGNKLNSAALKNIRGLKSILQCS